MKKAVLLLNLGSPKSPTVPHVREYLREFLMDGRVIDVAYPLRYFLVNFAIIPKRVEESTAAYKSIWTEKGSPLVVISKNTRELLQKEINMPVELCMRYQEPSITSAIEKLAKQGITQVFLIPLFPHFAMSSFETAEVRVRELAASVGNGMKVEVIKPFYNHPEYIEALYQASAPSLAESYDHILFSFHGLPERHLHKTDPTGSHCLKAANCCEIPSPAHATCYRAQCYATVRALAERAGIAKEKYSVSFQSRLGKDPWIKPWTDLELPRLAKEGVKKLLLFSPAFVADCLETIEELGIRGKETFLEAGGAELKLVPCMNVHPRWIEALKNFVAEKWPEALSRPKEVAISPR